MKVAAPRKTKVIAGRGLAFSGLYKDKSRIV